MTRPTTHIPEDVTIGPLTVTVYPHHAGVNVDRVMIVGLPTGYIWCRAAQNEPGDMIVQEHFNEIVAALQATYDAGVAAGKALALAPAGPEGGNA